MQTFIKDDAEAILRIPLSHRAVVDSIIWLPNKNGGYSVKSGYHVTKQILRQDDWAESFFFFFLRMIGLKVHLGRLVSKYGLICGSFMCQIKLKFLAGELAEIDCNIGIYNDRL